MGRTDSFLPGKVNCGAADVALAATAVPVPTGVVVPAAALVAVLAVSGAGTEPATSVVTGEGDAVLVG